MTDPSTVPTERIRVRVSALCVGDRLVGSGRTVTRAPFVTLRTSPGYCNLDVANRAGVEHSCCWRKSTLVLVDRPQARVPAPPAPTEAS